MSQQVEDAMSVHVTKHAIFFFFPLASESVVASPQECFDYNFTDVKSGPMFALPHCVDIFITAHKYTGFIIS